MASWTGDMAAEVAEQLRKDSEKELKEASKPIETFADHNVMTSEKKGIFSKVEFAWRDSDKRTLEQIRAAASSMFINLFDDAITILDNLYATLYVAELTENDIPRTDSTGRVIWQTNANNEPLEDWTQLNGEDIEHCLFDLTRLRLHVAPKVNELLMEAMFAKRIHVDAFDDAYIAMLDGTIQDKQSKSNRKSRQDNYHAFFRYWLWSQGDTFLKELNNFQRVLERTRDWRVRSQWK